MARYPLSRYQKRARFMLVPGGIFIAIGLWFGFIGTVPEYGANGEVVTQDDLHAVRDQIVAVVLFIGGVLAFALGWVMIALGDRR